MQYSTVLSPCVQDSASASWYFPAKQDLQDRRLLSYRRTSTVVGRESRGPLRGRDDAGGIGEETVV